MYENDHGIHLQYCFGVAKDELDKTGNYLSWQFSQPWKENGGGKKLQSYNLNLLTPFNHIEIIISVVFNILSHNDF